MGSLELEVQVEVHANVICILSNFNLQIYIHTTTALKMAHIRGESDIRMQQSSTNSSMSSSQQSSFSSNVNRSSASSSTARYGDSRSQAQGDQRYYIEDNFGGRRYIDGPPQQNNGDRELELEPSPDSLPAPALSQEPPAQKQMHLTGAPTSQPAYQ